MERIQQDLIQRFTRELPKNDGSCGIGGRKHFSKKNQLSRTCVRFTKSNTHDNRLSPTIKCGIVGVT